MDIGEVARQAGLPASTIRYYESKGLIHSVGRHGLRRQFSAGVINQLALISLGCRVGFSLDEMSLMFTADGTQINRQLLADKAAELDEKVKELTMMRDGLQHAAMCRAASHFECPKFLRIVSMSARKNFRTINKLKK